jgi:O-antigen/teichoic acid export membrane protein
VIKDNNYFSTDHLNVGLKGRALKGASVTLVAQVVCFGIQTIGVILLARLMTPGDFGLVTMVLTISLLLQNFGVNGFTEAIIQMKEIDHKKVSTLFWINVASSVLLTLLFIASSPVIVWFYKEARLHSIIMAIAASIVLAGLSVEHLALLRRSMQFSRIAANDVVAATISIVIPISLAWRGWGYWALVAKWIMLPLVTTIGAWVICRWRPGLPSRGSGVKPMLAFAMNTYGNFVMSYFRRNIDKVLIGRVYGNGPLGAYDRAYHLSSMLPTQIVMPIYSVAVSTFSRLCDDPYTFRSKYLKVLSILSFIGVPLSAALTITSSDVILLILGPQWEETGQIFCAFGVSIGVIIIYITHGWLHLSLGTPDRWLRWGVIEFGVSLLCFLIGLPFGALGVAIAYSLSYFILVGPALWYAGKPIQLKMTLVLSELWRYYVSAMVAGFVCWFLLYKWDVVSVTFGEFNVLFRVIMSFSLCISIYLGFIVTLFRGFSPILQFIVVLREMIPGISFRKRTS